VEVETVANREPWDEDLKQQTKALYLADGAALASSVTGVPVRTVRQWAKVGNWRQQTPATGQPADQRLHLVTPVPGVAAAPSKSQVPAGYGLARRVLLRRLGDTASLALDLVAQELAAGHTSKARDCAIICGIALDKAELLAKAGGQDVGGAMPTVAEATSRLRELAADLTSRSRAGG
jgi:hypothetical protein